MSGPGLADPVGVGTYEAPSRVVFGPHETNLGDGRSLSDRHVAYYARRAGGGAGVVIIETASVTDDDWPYERAPLARACPEGWTAIQTACAPFGTVVLAGLGHAGLQGSSAYSQSVMWAPSRVADVVSREPPAELEQAGIDGIVYQFARAAALAVRSGLHGVEIDSGPRSLLRQFQSGLTNQRPDRYGQDRIAFTREVLAAVRDAIGPGQVLALRLCCDELAPWAGITPDQAEEAVRQLAPSVDLLTIVLGGPYSTSAYRPAAHSGVGFNAGLCRRMHQAAAGQSLTVLQGSVTDPVDAGRHLAEGVCDLVEMTRAQIADARLVGLVRAGRSSEVRPCLLCNQACQVRDNRNPIVSCVVDPSAGHETTDQTCDGPGATEPSGDRSSGPPVLVVGAGPAGLECARVLAGAGRRVRVAERGDREGGAVRAAAMGAGRQRLALAPAWLASECRRLGVELHCQADVTASVVQTSRAEGWEVVLATGGRPFTGRHPATDVPVMVDVSAALMDGTAQWPEGPVVIDDPVGDGVAISLAERLAADGRPDITIVCPDPVAGTQLARTGDLADANVRLQRAGIQRRLRSLIRSVGSGTVALEDCWTGEPAEIPAAVFVDGGHRLPDESLYQDLGDPTIVRIGDCVAPRTILEAILEGRVAALTILAAGMAVGARQ